MICLDVFFSLLFNGFHYEVINLTTGWHGGSGPRQPGQGYGLVQDLVQYLSPQERVVITFSVLYTDLCGHTAGGEQDGNIWDNIC